MPHGSNIASFEVKKAGTWTLMAVVGSASVDMSRSVVDVTEWNLDYGIALPGPNVTTLTVDAFTDPLDTTYTLFEDAYDNATEVEVRVAVATSPTSQTYSMKGYITKLAVTFAAKDLIRTKFTLSGSDITLIA